MSSPQEVTKLLIAWSHGSQAAFEQLMPLVYTELHRMAKRYMVKENPGHTLQTTALINEAYIRLAGQSGKQWHNRAHFFGVAASAMRHVLVDYARACHSEKRGSSFQAVSLDEAITISRDRLREVIALDDALSMLEKLSPRQSRVVELRFFGGMSVQETAALLKLSPDTVMRDWRAAKAWLYREITGQSVI